MLTHLTLGKRPKSASFEETGIGRIVLQVPRIVESGRARARRCALEVRLTENADGCGAVSQYIAANIVDQHAVVLAIGDEQPLSRFVHGESHGQEVGCDAAAHANAEVDACRSGGAGDALKIGLPDHHGGIHPAVQRAGSRFVDQDTVVAVVCNEKPFQHRVVGDTARSVECCRPGARVATFQVILADDGNGTGIVTEPVGVHVENQHAVVRAIGNKEPLVLLVQLPAGNRPHPVRAETAAGGIEVRLTDDQLCRGELRQPVRVAVVDQNAIGKHVYREKPSGRTVDDGPGAGEPCLLRVGGRHRTAAEQALAAGDEPGLAVHGQALFVQLKGPKPAVAVGRDIEQVIGAVQRHGAGSPDAA